MCLVNVVCFDSTFIWQTTAGNAKVEKTLCTTEFNSYFKGISNGRQGDWEMDLGSQSKLVAELRLKLRALGTEYSVSTTLSAYLKVGMAGSLAHPSDAVI